MADSTSSIPHPEETQRSGESEASAAERVQRGGEEERTVPLEQLQASVEDGQEMTAAGSERQGLQQPGLGMHEPLLEEQTANGAADQNAQRGDHVSELPDVSTTDTDHPTTSENTLAAASSFTSATDQAPVASELLPIETPAPPPPTMATAQPTQETEETPPLLPLEHARQPYSSQSSNARYGTASSSGGMGGSSGAAARGMPMCMSFPHIV
ncbi:hypothetical protein QFC19_002825 [Naganishia cerealis]|uniref:Uncharacterized protein n=1 Tax=Naganishia cerealis TaxID=610337 RepID=A0ACC2W793_9TREE|nr:hypothetical protein QFC19_002825 [Naganishia cerealis]